MNMFKNIDEKAELLKALAHPTRLCIVQGLLTKKTNVTGIVDCLKVAQPTISQHLRILKAAGIITGTRNGLEMNYTVINETVKAIIRVLE